jgi:hypothetical protein
LRLRFRLRLRLRLRLTSLHKKKVSELVSETSSNSKNCFRDAEKNSA